MTWAPLGVAICVFNSSDVILGCLDSLFASEGAALRVAVIDNASTDASAALIRDWAHARAATDPGFTFAEHPAGWETGAEASLTLLHSPFNGGYAHGVNTGLRALLADPAMNLFWILNPDCHVAPDTAAKYLAAGADGAFALMAGRTLFSEGTRVIQTDGGRVNRWTGVCSSVNAKADPATTALPDATSLDYLTGANIVASRRFIEEAGLMVEDYFLYYEEVDWALRRGGLPLRLVDDAIVYHIGGTTIGSGTNARRASPFANYFNYRNRMRFLARHNPVAVPVGLAYAGAKAVQLAMKGAPDEAWGLLAGALGLAPPRAIRERIAPGEARRLAFGKPD